jgi:hypothetical protein
MQQTSSNTGIAIAIALLRSIRGCANTAGEGNSMGSAEGTGKSVAMNTPFVHLLDKSNNLFGCYLHLRQR